MGTTRGGTRYGLRGFMAVCLGLGSLLLPVAGLADRDVGDIAVIEADATIVPERFDLEGHTLEFVPQAVGGYGVTTIPFVFEGDVGADVQVGNDAASARKLAFSFPFFDREYSTIFIGSNGFITFSAPSTLAQESLEAFAGYLPRIAVLWDDLDPSSAGRVYFQGFADRAVVTWEGLPEFETLNTNTFQAVLFNNGTVRMSYERIALEDGLVGLSPGSASELFGTLVDFTAGATASIVTDFEDTQLIAQVFGDSTATELLPVLPLQAVARKFYQRHEDDFDQLVIVTTFPHDMGSAFAFELTVHQSVRGIGLPLFSFVGAYGSSGRLQGVLNMNRLDIYPDNPHAEVLGSFSTVDVLAHETGHEWLAFVRFDDGGVDSTALLGRGQAHWSFFHDTQASVMEGNGWMDHGDGTFTSVEASQRFSVLDQYLMGLLSPAEVTDFFFIDDPLDTDHTPASRPEVGVTVAGARHDVNINQVITAEGVREPVAGFSDANPTAVLRQAFVLVVRPGESVSAADIGKWEAIRAAWEAFFPRATGDRGAIETDLATAVCVHDGDANRDGSLTPADALLAFRHFLGIASPPLNVCRQTRVNVASPESTAVTPADALCIFRKFLGLSSCLD